MKDDEESNNWRQTHESSLLYSYLAGLRCLKNIERIGSELKHLNLSCNDLSDLSPLSSLTFLQELNLAENKM